MNSKIIIKKMGFTPDEVKRLTGFLHSIDNIFYVPLSKTVNIANYANKALSNGLIVIAELEGRIIGALIGYANDSIKKSAYISSFGILEEYRSHGIGGKILKKFKNLCKNYGMKKIELYTHHTNEAAMKFYTRNDFTNELDLENRTEEVYLVCDLFSKSFNDIENKNILVTAIGSFSADIVIKTLKAHGCNVIGCDIYPKEWIAEAYAVNQFYQAPFVSEKENYINFIDEICRKHNVEYIFPLTDPEVDVLSSVKQRYLGKGITVCVSDEHIIRLVRNKYMLPQFLKEEGINHVIPTKLLSEVDLIEGPSFIKPISGRSSEGCRPVYSNTEFINFKKTIKESEYIIQPLIEGNIITVDIVKDPNSENIICIARRELLRNKSGAGTTIEIIENAELNSLCMSIAKKISIIGAVNFEFIENSDGSFYFLEINPRFSGGVEFSQMAGYDVVGNHLKCFSNKKISRENTIKKMIITRKYEEYVTKFIND